MTHILEADSVFLEFDSKRVLQGVYIKSETGKVTGLLGRNGSGKSCLMKIIYGELSPNDKSIRLNGNRLLNGFRSPKDIKYLPQKSYIPKHLTIKRIFKDFNLDFSNFTNEFPEFEKFYESKFGNLSGGERRIIEIYAVLVSKTKICMLDEPFSMVMPLHVEKIKNLILREKKNKGIIITDHLYNYVIELCDNLYILKDGITYLTKSAEDIEKYGYIKK